MRKAYILKRLTNQVKRFAAIMLVTLIAVGSVFAEEVTFTFSEQGYSNAQVITEGDINSFISFTCAANNASAAPTYYTSGGAARFYAHAASGNGSSMTLIPLDGYEITGLTITATAASNAPLLGIEVNGGARTTYTAEGAVYTITGINATSSLKIINAATSSTQLRVVSLTVTYGVAPPPAVYAPVISPTSGNYYTSQSVSLTCATEGANIYYSINGADPILYNAPFTIDATATVTAYATLGEDVSATTTAQYVFPVFLSNIAAFYAAEDASLYKINSDMTFVYRNGRYMYVKDATGGLLIYDNYNPIITNEYNEGDVFTGGVVGTRTIYNGLSEFVPAMNPAEASSFTNVTPVEVTVAELLANPENYVSQLVVVRDGTFAAGTFTEGYTSNLNLTQNGSSVVVRSAFKNITAAFAANTVATVVGLVTIYNNAVQLYPRDNNDIHVSSFPCSYNFEGADAYDWTIVNGDNTNKWFIGKAQGFDNKKLYITSSNGLTNKYNVSAASTVHAYTTVTLPASDVLLTFDCRTAGEANDYLQVTVMDEAPEAGVLPENSLTRIFGVNEFGPKTVLIPASYAGEKYLVFTWHNNNTGGVQPPAAIDNVVITPTCTQISNIAATVNEHTAVVTWNAPAGQNAWTLEYKNVDDDVWQTVDATTTSVTLNNLSTETTYDVRVKANCGDGSSAWVNSQFYVPCIQLTLGPVEMTIGTGTSTSNVAPANAYYKNSWTQMVYPASEFATAGYINAVSWYVNAALTHNYDYFKIYMGTKSDAINNSTSDWIPMEDLTLVYESYNGSLGTEAGWETYTLSTPYYYNGEDNLVIVTARTAGAYNSVQYRYTSVTNSVLYRRSDSSPESYGAHPGTATGVTAANLPNMMIDYTGLVCGDAHCVAPAELAVNHITTTSAVLNWEAGDATAWQVSYKAQDDDTWTVVDVTENTYTMADLNQNTTYNVRVVAECGVIGSSTEAATSFTTVADCQAPTYLNVDHHVANTVVTWVGVPGVTSYEVQYSQVGVNLWNAALVNNVTSFAINGLAEGASCEVRVRSLCGENMTSDWVSTTFTRPVYCNAPTGITATDIAHNAITLTWNEGEGTSWTVEYGEAGFTLGEGMVEFTNTNSVTLTGLNAQTTYNIYVKANCGGYPAAWSEAYNVTTACAPYTVTAAVPWFEDFEGYLGGGEQPFQCWATPVKPNGPFVYCGYAQSCHSGYNSAEFKGSTNVLVLPEFTNDIHTLSLSFWATATTTSLGQVEVGVLTDMNDMDSFELVSITGVPGPRGSTSGVAGNGNFMGPFHFNNVAATNGRIALRYTSTNAYQSWNLDDFTVFIAQSCPAPTDIVASNVTTDQAVISWTAGGDETAWELQYAVADFVPGTATSVNTTVTNDTLTGLAAGTTYYVYVKAVCSASDESVWAGPYTFTTALPANTCIIPTELALSEVTENSATLTWTGDTAVTYEVSYKAGTEAAWTTMTVTGTTATLTGLTANTTYFAHVKAVCDEENTYSNMVSFLATSAMLSCTNRTISEENGSSYYTPLNDYYNNSHSEQIFTPEEVGAPGNITKISFNYAGTNTMTAKTNVKIYLGHTDKDVFSSTSDWITEGLTLVYTGDLNCSTGWNEFVLDDAFAYNGIDNLVVRVVDESGSYGSSANKFYYTNCTGNKCLTWQNDYNTWQDASSKTGTLRTYRPDIRFYVCSSADDIAINAIHNIPNACDLTNIPVTIDITNVGTSHVSAFEAYYSINEGAAVHESVLLADSLAQGDSYTYTFITTANMTEAANVITAWVEIPGDGNFLNNVLVSDPINMIEALTAPFVETFNAGEINDGWFTRDLNQDNVTFNIADGMATYTYNDELNADDWLMTSCLFLPAGRYNVYYSYKAIDPAMTENFGVYYGKKVGDDYVMNNEVATHEFSNENYVTAYNVIEIAESGVYYFGIHAASIAGNAGFNINDFNIKSTINFTANAGANGSVIPSGSIEATQGNLYTLTIIPDLGYHVMAIYKNMVQVLGESQGNASVQYYTFTPNDGDNIYVTFTNNSYEVNATVGNLFVTDYNDNAPGAIYTPNHQVVGHGGSHTGVITMASHYHLVYVTVNGMDVTSDLVELNNNQYQLTINNIYEDKDIYVLAGLDSTTITYTVLAGQGTINNEIVVDGTTTLPATYTVTLPGYADLLSTIVPAPGYHVASIIIDGVEHTNIEAYLFERLFDEHTVQVVFAPNSYVITTAGYGNGTVSAGAAFDYDPDYTYTFTATPDAGYCIGTLTRNNVILTVEDPFAGYTETLTNILDNYDYVVTFVQSVYTITATCGANGTVSPTGTSAFLYHQNAVYDITAAPGYYIASVTVDGVTTDYTQADALTSTTYTFANVDADHTINATFAPMMFEIAVNAGAHGTITPATASYQYGETPTFTITPDAGYSIVNVTVDGYSIGAVSTYTFTALTAAHTISATFASNVYTITATAGNGGTISPAGASTVAYNSDKTYTISANSGYHVSNVFVDGVSVGAVTTYTFTGVTANHTIYAAFEANEYTVTVNQPSHGTITPGTTTVLYNATPSFVITPATGYNVTAITVNGSNVSLTNVPNVNGTYTYTFAAINANQTLTATMTAKTYTISASAGSNGSITPNGNTTVNYGGTQVYTITPANGYVIAQVTVDGMSVGTPTSYVFTNVVANHTITATFALAECEIPTYLYTTHIDSTSAMLHWSHPSATSFDIQYKTPTSTFTAVSNVTGNSYQLTNLNPATTYMWQVRANCSGSNHSDWTNLVVFTTDNTTIDETGIEDLVKNSIKVYAERQNVHILNNEGMSIDNVRIFDAYGKLIYSGAVNTTHEVISLNVAAGTYIVDVTTDEGIANYKVTILK